MFGFDRIIFDPQVMDGRACIRGMRITVSLIVNLVASGMTVKQIIEEYPYIKPDDVDQSLQHTDWHSRSRVKVAGIR
jgi:uncharacterized protein (DUF433 family)